MGSFFAGVKAGTLAGVLYIGGLAVFNVLLLFALKPEVLHQISQSYSLICTAGPTTNTTSSLEDCFSLLVAVDVPFIAFVGFFITILYAGVFGMYYDRLPGGSKILKGEVLALVVVVNLILFGFYGFYFDQLSGAATAIFLLPWTVVFGYFAGRLYKKYTRVVGFKSQDPKELRVFIDGRDLTDRTRTLAATSTHKVRAEVADDASFKEWEVTGGVSIEDPRSFESVIEVNGDGEIIGHVGTKY